MMVTNRRGQLARRPPFGPGIGNEVGCAPPGNVRLARGLRVAILAGDPGRGACAGECPGARAILRVCVHMHSIVCACSWCLGRLRGEVAQRRRGNDRRHTPCVARGLCAGAPMPRGEDGEGGGK